MIDELFACGVYCAKACVLPDGVYCLRQFNAYGV